MGSEKDAKLAQKLGQLQPFVAVFLQECMANLHLLGQPNTFLAADDDETVTVVFEEAGLDEGLSSLCLPIIVCMENPYKRDT